MDLISTYPFLVLCLLLWVPSAALIALRKDLRPVQLRIGLLSLPFATTEWMFYPDYWAPKFLFDLVDIIGFGIEDFLFVSALGVFSSSAWFVATGKSLELKTSSIKLLTNRASKLLLVCAILVALCLILGIPMIWASPIIMAGMTVFIVYKRRDLVRPAWQGGGLVCAVYTAICLVLAALIPDVFALNWNVEKFSGISILGIPLEEYTYSLTAGALATIFYPYAWSSPVLNR